MEITIKKTISRETLENIFVTAIEGGSNYWYDIPESEVKKIQESTERGRSFSERLFDAVYDKGVDIDIHDGEEPEEKLGTLSRSTMQDRLQRMSETGNAWALYRELEQSGDAESSDVIFQHLVMGETVFG